MNWTARIPRVAIPDAVGREAFVSHDAMVWSPLPGSFDGVETMGKRQTVEIEGIFQLRLPDGSSPVQNGA